MSESTSSSREMRTCYNDFKNAYEKCREVFDLDDVFFKGKFFSCVLKEILDKLTANEQNSFKNIESVVPPVSLGSYLLNRLGSYNTLSIDLQYRFIFILLVCKTPSPFLDKLESEFQNILKTDSADSFCDKIWQQIKVYSVFYTINSNNLWNYKIPFGLSSDGSLLVIDILPKMTLFDFFVLYLNLYPREYDIFPKTYAIDKSFYCNASDWKGIKGKFTNVITSGCGPEPAEYDVVQFKHPFLVTIDSGNITGPRLPDTDIPIIVKFHTNSS